MTMLTVGNSFTTSCSNSTVFDFAEHFDKYSQLAFVSAFTKTLPEKNLNRDRSDMRFIDRTIRTSLSPKGIGEAIIQPRTLLTLKLAPNSET
jgi:hypothetical protein